MDEAKQPDQNARLKGNDDFDFELLKMAQLFPKFTTVELIALEGILAGEMGQRRLKFAETLMNGMVPREPVIRDLAAQTAKRLIEKAIKLVPKGTMSGATFISAAEAFIENECGELPPSEDEEDGPE